MKGIFYAIQELIKEGKSEEAIRQLDNYIHTHPDCNDEPYYLLGNAYRKQGNWQLALNNYMSSTAGNTTLTKKNSRKIRSWNFCASTASRVKKWTPTKK